MSSEPTALAKYESATLTAKNASQRLAEKCAERDGLRPSPALPPAKYARRRLELDAEVELLDAEANAANKLREEAAEEVEAERVKGLVESEGPAVEAADAALAALTDAVDAAADLLVEPLALVASTSAARDAVRASLRACGRPATRDAPTSIATAWPSLAKGPGAVGALLTAAAVRKFKQDEPARLAERAEFNRRKEAAAARQYRQEALKGEHGPAAMKEAEEEVRADLRRMYPARGGGAFGGIRGTVAAREVETYRSNLSINGRPVED